MLKRIFDFIVSLLLLGLLSPLILMCALLIKLDSRGNVFFKQLRVGKNEKLFCLYKFRTLKNNSPELHINVNDIKDLDNFVFPSPPDAEKTRVGYFLRKSSINEIPQLFNVLKGEMSLVGPRPEVPEIVRLYNGRYKKRLSVKPGITGLAQVAGRGELKLKDVIERDVEYINNQSFFLDLQILWKTISVVASNQGAH